MGSTEKEAGGAARTSVGAEGMGERNRLVGTCILSNYLNAVMAVIPTHIFQASLNTELSTLNILPVALSCSSLLLSSPQILPSEAVGNRLLSR